MKSECVDAQIERIQQMEQLLNEVTQAADRLSDALARYAELQPKIKVLKAYYGSKEWFADFDADCAGELPPDLKRGVLSEDAVYNLLAECDRLQPIVGRLPKEDECGKGNEVERTDSGN